MTKELTITTPSGRRFSIQREGITFTYTITEPSGRKFRHDLLGRDECKELVTHDLSRDLAGLAAY